MSHQSRLLNRNTRKLWKRYEYIESEGMKLQTQTVYQYICIRHIHAHTTYSHEMCHSWRKRTEAGSAIGADDRTMLPKGTKTFLKIQCKTVRVCDEFWSSVCVLTLEHLQLMVSLFPNFATLFRASKSSGSVDLVIVEMSKIFGLERCQRFGYVVHYLFCVHALDDLNDDSYLAWANLFALSLTSYTFTRFSEINRNVNHNRIRSFYVAHICHGKAIEQKKSITDTTVAQIDKPDTNLKTQFTIWLNAVYVLFILDNLVVLFNRQFRLNANDFRWPILQ